MAGLAQLLLPVLDPDNKAAFVGWMQDSINEQEDMFQVPLMLDLDALAAYEPPVPAMMAEPDEPKPRADVVRAPVKLVRNPSV